ncbi:hypothetical protein BRC83_09750 [Halobacteriales archaeon QS_1_68_17]|nr:MAG: hypothetical protein BRC83_09750 [Halobacteriales archaeon QS_1_68_17]
MTDRTRQYAGLGVGAVLIVAGTLATGLLPPTPLYQVLAGAIIVGGFAVAFASFGAFDLSE